MQVEFKAYPKCECGTDLVPIMKDEKVDPNYTRRHNHLLHKKSLSWKCSKCNKVVEITEKKD